MFLPTTMVGLLLHAQWAGDIDRLIHGWHSAAATRSTAANAGSATLPADVGS